MFKQRFAQTALLSALGFLAAGAAHAANFTNSYPLGTLTIGTATSVEESVTGNSFTDQLTFSLNNPAGIVSSTQDIALTLNNITFQGISNLSTSLYNQSGQLLEGPVASPISGSSGELYDSSLAAGNYYFTVSGTVTGIGSPQGQYAFTVEPVAPVPEPAEAVLMALGFGLVGVFTLRRKQLSLSI